MLVGVDWGGTKIEAIAIADDGRTIARLREVTPPAPTTRRASLRSPRS